MYHLLVQRFKIFLVDLQLRIYWVHRVLFSISFVHGRFDSCPITFLLNHVLFVQGLSAFFVHQLQLAVLQKLLDFSADLNIVKCLIQLELLKISVFGSCLHQCHQLILDSIQDASYLPLVKLCWVVSLLAYLVLDDVLVNNFLVKFYGISVRKFVVKLASSWLNHVRFFGTLRIVNLVAWLSVAVIIKSLLVLMNRVFMGNQPLSGTWMLFDISFIVNFPTHFQESIIIIGQKLAWTSTRVVSLNFFI